MNQNQEDIMRIMNVGADADPKESEKMFYEVLDGSLTCMQLKGTEKQIAWVRNIIKEMIRGIKNLYPSDYIQVIAQAKSHHDCKWWISNRSKRLSDVCKSIETGSEEEDIAIAQDLWNSEVDFF